MEALRGAWELLFSLPWLDDMAGYLHSLPLHPVFSSVHFILTAFALRKEPGSAEFAVQHPVASCVMTYIVASSGGILANLMTGAPPLECVANGWSVAVAVISWYLVFLGPLDVCFHLRSVLPVQLALSTVEEVGRAKNILSGVSSASALYPQSLLAMTIVGLVKGSGKRWGITLYRLVYQPQSASVMELKKLSFITKFAAFVALLFALNSQSQFCAQHQLLMVAAFLLVLRHLIVPPERDPLEPLQHGLWRLATALTIPPPPPKPKEQ